jgi:hypothetical protein
MPYRLPNVLLVLPHYQVYAPIDKNRNAGNIFSAADTELPVPALFLFLVLALVLASS